MYSAYKKQRIIYYYRLGYRSPTICLLLRKEHLRTSRVGVAKFIAKYNETGSLMRRPGSGHPSKITPEMKAIVEPKMREDDEATTYQLHALLILNQYKNSPSLSHCTWLDFSLQCLLPTQSRRKQGEVPRMGPQSVTLPMVPPDQVRQPDMDGLPGPCTAATLGPGGTIYGT